MPSFVTGAGVALPVARVAAKVVLKSAMTGLDLSGCGQGGCSLLPEPGLGSVWCSRGLVMLLGVALCQPLSPACRYRHASW